MFLRILANSATSHLPSYDRLAQLSAAGISADHEGIDGQDALNRLRLGMWTMLRQSSLRPDLEQILQELGDVVNTSRRLMLTTDGAAPVRRSRRPPVHPVCRARRAP